jgi:hypothetical protein
MEKIRKPLRQHHLLFHPLSWYLGLAAIALGFACVIVAIVRVAL